MKMRLATFVALVLSAGTAAAQWQQDLSHELVKHTLVVRNFYTGQKLRFAPDGAVISAAAAMGFGAADARIYVEAVQFAGSLLRITGERPITLFDPATGDTSELGLHSKVAIDIQLPAGDLQETATRTLLDRIFLTPAETRALECSDAEAQAFRQRMLRAKATVSVRKDNPNVGDHEPHQLCFPGGARGYIVGGKVQPPKPLKTPDPAYPPSELGSHENKTVLLTLIVDTEGKPASPVVVTASPTIFDVVAVEAVRHWKFLPATYQGKPVPAAIDVEVNFRTH